MCMSFKAVFFFSKLFFSVIVTSIFLLLVDWQACVTRYALQWFCLCWWWLQYYSLFIFTLPLFLILSSLSIFLFFFDLDIGKNKCFITFLLCCWFFIVLEEKNCSNAKLPCCKQGSKKIILDRYCDIMEYKCLITYQRMKIYSNFQSLFKQQKKSVYALK